MRATALVAASANGKKTRSAPAASSSPRSDSWWATTPLSPA